MQTGREIARTGRRRAFARVVAASCLYLLCLQQFLSLAAPLAASAGPICTSHAGAAIGREGAPSGGPGPSDPGEASCCSLACPGWLAALAVPPDGPALRPERAVSIAPRPAAAAPVLRPARRGPGTARGPPTLV